MTDLIEKLTAAIESMPTGALPPSELSYAWPAIGRQIPIGWLKEIDRALRLARKQLAAAESAGPTDDGRTEVEHAYWRLGSARDQVRMLIALLLDVPCLYVKRRRFVSLKPEWDDVKKALGLLDAQGHGMARDVVQLHGRLGGKLLIRHQQSHSLAPILAAPSLVHFEVGHIRSPGGVYGFRAHQMVPSGALDEKNFAPEILFSRALREGHSAYELLVALIGKLTDLIESARLQLPLPPIVWQVDETGDLFLDRQAAHAASQAASGVTPKLAIP